jgi:hypothetical protein
VRGERRDSVRGKRMEKEKQLVMTSFTCNGKRKMGKREQC